MLPIRIIDRDFNLLGEIDKYTSLIMPRSAYGIGVCELRVNRYTKYADKLQIDNIIFPSNQTNKAYVIKYRQIELDEDGKATENWYIRAYQLKFIAMQRLIYPSVGMAENAITGDVETVLKYYINTEMVNPTDASRVYPNLIIATNQNRGININASARYDNLADKISEIAALANISWDITIDLENKKFIFDVNEGLNRSTNQDVIAPAIFSTEFNTLKNMSYSESKINYKNVAIVGGKGEGTERPIEIVGEATGHNRYEIFVDSSSDDLPLETHGQNMLVSQSQEIYCEGQILTHSILKYEKDYDLNDVVTLQNKSWGITMDSRITEVTEVIEPNTYSVDVVFDNDQPTLIKKIKDELKEMKKVLRM